MDYIFDASTLILLAKTTLLRKFSESNKIIIPQAVKLEVLDKKELEDAKIIRILIEESIVNENKENFDSKKFISDFNIEEGEAQALTLAFKEKKILATDDLRAIKACKILGIKFITAIHCLIYLYKGKNLDEKIALEKLKKLEKYGRYNADIMRNAKNIIQGDKNG